ncbi:serine hydrolase domain-containing protein [Glycomyces tenuis]|uniref:serine hydrolase domain-containing protein n=1 Tax=Glycomyces tenuis TaxID=58116 RepID=UPI000405F8AC|nr:serine hydrolase domain-containing protein [Glycomyces tenuis]
MWKPLLAGAVSAGIVLVPGSAQAEPDDISARIEAVVVGYVEEARAAQEIPGAAVSVVADGATVYSDGFGHADLEARTPVDPERTGFLIGSQAKLLTAQAALRLVAEGRLDLDTDVNEYLDGFQIEDAYPGRPVTLRHLLTHTAGFDDDHLVGSGGTDPAEIPDFSERIAEVQPERVRPPGASVTYSNYGFALAGYLVEAVSGVPYEDYVAEHVLAPLGMDGTTVALPYPEAIAAAKATGYAIRMGQNTAVDLAYADFPASGAGPVATSADMARYMAAALDADPRLGPGVAEQMLARQYTEHESLPGMGFGWEQIRVAGHDAWFKGGDFPGFHTTMFLLPEYGIGLHIAANGDGYGGAGIDGHALAELLAAELLPVLEAPAPEPMPGGDSEQYEGQYRSSRISEHSLYKLQSLFETPVRVEAAGDGGIVTHGIWGDGVTWVQVAPGQFQRPGTWDRLVFTEEGTIAVSGASEVLVRTGPLESPRPHLAVLGLGVAAALIGLLWFPVAALIARRRGRVRPRTARAASLTAWGACALVATVAVLLIGLAGEPSAFQIAVATASAPLVVLLAAATPTVPACAAMAAFSVLAWRRRWWPKHGRVGYTILTATTVAFACIATVYNMTGPSYT